MTVPPDVRAAVERALGTQGLLRSAEPVAGGCISHGARIRTTGGGSFFLKWNARAPAGMFQAEADGLTALRAPRCVRAPEPVAWGGGAGTPAWIVLEYLPHSRPAPDSDARLGRALAALHDAPVDPAFGWESGNWIGSLPQSNEADDSWGRFWAEQRLAPQLALARSGGHLRDGALDRLLEVVPAALDDVTGTSLLHGDLWSGNTFTTEGGEPALVDPAVYRGDGEVDLAMTELFGGFGAGFYAAYDEARGISEAYRAYRRSLYQLYYLLVHVNLFGGSYVGASQRAARTVLGALV